MIGDFCRNTARWNGSEKNSDKPEVNRRQAAAMAGYIDNVFEDIAF